MDQLIFTADRSAVEFWERCEIWWKHWVSGWQSKHWRPINYVRTVL